MGAPQSSITELVERRTALCSLVASSEGAERQIYQRELEAINAMLSEYTSELESAA